MMAGGMFLLSRKSRKVARLNFVDNEGPVRDDTVEFS
jgi:hypothetical protein